MSRPVVGQAAAAKSKKTPPHLSKDCTSLASASFWRGLLFGLLFSLPFWALVIWEIRKGMLR